MAGFTGFLKVLVSFGWLAVIAIGGWFGWNYLNEDKVRDELLVEQERTLQEQEKALEKKDLELAVKVTEIIGLEKGLREKEAEVEHLELSLSLLKVSKRTAQVAVLDRTGSAENGDLVTKLKFVEVDETGDPVGRSRTFEIEGDLLYVDAWVVKFDDALVQEGKDSLRSASLCVFRRMFGEHQEPAKGVTLDEPDQRPDVYGGSDGELGEFEKQIWSNFWELANDPAKAKELGIRAIHGEAPSMRLQKGKIYKLTLRAAGGLDFETMDTPAVMED